MKTNFSRLAYLLVLAFLTVAPLSAQDHFDYSITEENSDYLFGNVYVEDLKNEIDLYTLDDKTITVDYYEARDVEYTVQEVLAAYMLAMGLGLGFGEGDTSYCLHATVFLRLAMFTTAALYGGIGLLYDGQSTDFLTQSLFGITGYLLMYSALTKYREVFLIYGLRALYGFGTQDVENSVKFDITQFSISAMLGFMFMLSPQWAIMLYTPLITYLSFKQEYDGNESKDNSTFFNINKNAVVLFSLVYTFGAMRDRQIIEQ